MIAIVSANGSEINFTAKVIKSGVICEQILISPSDRRYFGLIVKPRIIM